VIPATPSGAVTVSAAILSVVCAVLGMLISILAETPVGSTIVAADILAFGLCCLIGNLKDRA
jgi:zinc transport system permease protein